MIGTSNLQPSWPILNFLPPSLEQREGQSENTLCQASRMTWRLVRSGTHCQQNREEPSLGRCQRWALQQAASSWIAGSTESIHYCDNLLQSSHWKVQGEDSGEGSIQNILLPLITTQPNHRLNRVDGFQFVPLLFVFCHQLCVLHKAHSCCGTGQEQSVPVLFEWGCFPGGDILFLCFDLIWQHILQEENMNCKN